MKKYILKKVVQLFYDGHGKPDFGGTTISVEYTDRYNHLELDGKTCYDSELQPYEDDDYDDEDDYGPQAQDGYNCEENDYYFKEITEEEYNKYKTIIYSYNNLNILNF